MPLPRRWRFRCRASPTWRRNPKVWQRLAYIYADMICMICLVQYHWRSIDLYLMCVFFRCHSVRVTISVVTEKNHGSGGILFPEDHRSGGWKIGELNFSVFQEGFGELVVGGMTLQHRKLGELLGESWILDHGHLPVGRCVRHGWKQHPLKGAGKRPPPDGTMSSFSLNLRSSSRGRGQEAPKKKQSEILWGGWGQYTNV